MAETHTIHDPAADEIERLQAPVTVPSEQQIEAAAKAIYDIDPYYEAGEYVDGYSVSPGGHLTWKQAKARDAEFEGDRLMLPITKFAYDAARAAISALQNGGT